MRLLGIEIRNLLSFDSFDWRDIHERTNIIVGPNGGGKSNLVRAVRLAIDGLSLERMPFWAEDASHLGTRGTAFAVSLDLELTTETEKKLVTSFLGSAFAENLLSPVTQTTREGRLSVANYLYANLRPDHISPLFRGRLTVTRTEDGRWGSRYESIPGDPSFCWQLQSPDNHPLLTSGTPQEETERPLFDLWAAAFTDEEDTTRLNALLQANSAYQAPPVLDLTKSFSSFQGSVRLQLTDTHVELPTHRAFAEVARFDMNRGMTYGAQFLWHRLLTHGIVATENLRVPPNLRLPSDLPSLRDLDLSRGEDLAIYLFLLKNGERADRERFERVGASFCALTGRTFDVGVRAPRSGNPSEDTTAQLTLTTATSWGDIPLAVSGAGIGECLFISALLAHEQGVVFLDEPASNLHPGVQKLLLQVLDAQTHDQFFVVSHSPYMIPPETAVRLARLYLRDGATRIARVNARPGQTEAEYLRSINKDMRSSTDARALLFSQAAILVEGETELGALPVWWSSLGEPSFEAQNVTMYAVGSKTSFGRWIWYLTQMQIPWAIVCDGDAIGDVGARCDIGEQLRKANRANGALPLASDTFATRRQKLAVFGVFTLATSSAENFESLPLLASNWKSATQQVGDSKPRKGRYIAETNGCPGYVEKLLRDVMSRLC